MENWTLFSKDSFKIIHPCWSFVCHRGKSRLLPFRCRWVGGVLFVLFPLSPFLVSTAVPAVVTPLRLLTDSSSGTLLRVIRSCHGHRDERVEKCALVAGHRGSQVDALTKLEEDTVEVEEERNVRRSKAVFHKTINTICPVIYIYRHTTVMMDYSEFLSFWPFSIC